MDFDDLDSEEGEAVEQQSRATSSRVQFDPARNKTSSADSAGQEVLVYPTLFISHGTPALVLQADDPTHIFLRRLGSILPKPQYVIAVSAHWECNIATVTASSRPAIVHDYVGFPQSLYELHYQLRGCPSMAADICDTLLEVILLFFAFTQPLPVSPAFVRQAGIPVAADSHKGFDHGVWHPLMMMWPEGDIQVSF
jgi:4,5-DOPA dioxygenase extradiol